MHGGWRGARIRPPRQRPGRSTKGVPVPAKGVKKVAIAATAALALAASAALASSSPAQTGTTDLVRVLFVGNNWDGTADVIKRGGTQDHPDWSRVARINIIPDIQERLDEIYADPERLAYFLAIRQLVGEGHDQFVDDMFTSNDGQLLVVSRPSLADVVGIDLNTSQIKWRFRVAGQRSDHMAISPDGQNIAVSASTGNVVHILDTYTGQEVGRFESGDSPHENNYSKDGTKIYHASIGRVYTPTDQPELDTTKGDRRFQIVDVTTNPPTIIKKIDMKQKLAEAGYPKMSGTVRPMAIGPAERFIWFQVSFFHGFVEYDLAQDRVTRIARLPNLVPDMPREQYLLDSAHHGIAINPEGKRLCVAGTMDDYAAIVSRHTFGYRLLQPGFTKPYWVTNSGDGDYCFISWSGSDRISAISYEDRKLVDTVRVGDHPQRMRLGYVTRTWLQTH
jgi:DNA-binding beta-propeller fold protein YncE